MSSASGSCSRAIGERVRPEDESEDGHPHVHAILHLKNTRGGERWEGRMKGREGPDLNLRETGEGREVGRAIN